MTANDDPTVALLLNLAASALGDDTWQPDSEAVRHRGRVLRARRTVATVVGGLLAVGVAAGVPALAADRDAPTQPAQPTATAHQEPRTFGDGTVATLEPGLVAINRPDDSQQPVLDEGDLAGWRVTLTPEDTHDPRTAGLRVHLAGAELTDWTTDLTWRVGDVAADYADDPYLSVLPLGATGSQGATTDHAIVAGVLPSWQRDPVALLVSPRGWTTTDGTVRHVAELPTFRAPTPDGRLAFLVGATNEAARQLLDDDLVVFVGADGDVFLPRCGGGTVEACATEAIPADTLVAWINEPTQHFSSPVAPPTATAPGTAPPSGATAPGGDPAELIPGIVAAFGSGTAGSDGGIVFGPFAGARVTLVRDGAGSDSLAALYADGSHGPAQAVGKGVLGPGPLVATTTFDDLWDGMFTFGTVPSDLPGARVFFRSAPGAAIELPTFTLPAMADNPIEDTRQWYLVGVVEDAASQLATAGPGAGSIVFAGTDGTIEDSLCGFTECQDTTSQAAYADVRGYLEHMTPPKADHS